MVGMYLKIQLQAHAHTHAHTYIFVISEITSIKELLNLRKYSFLENLYYLIKLEKYFLVVS